MTSSPSGAKVRSPAQVRRGRRMVSVVCCSMLAMPCAMSSASGSTSCAGTGSALAGEPSSWPASGLKYQVSSTPATAGQRRWSVPAGASKLKALRRCGCSPSGGRPAACASVSAQAPAALTTVAASASRPSASFSVQPAASRCRWSTSAPVHSVAPWWRASASQPCSSACTSMSIASASSRPPSRPSARSTGTRASTAVASRCCSRPAPCCACIAASSASWPCQATYSAPRGARMGTSDGAA